jgi:hypothetical protein
MPSVSKVLGDLASSTGSVSLAAGSNTAPAITTSGDTNTGIFFPAADTIAFAEGGVESMRIDSSGNVGIGTSSPTRSLEIKNSSDYQIRFNNGTTAQSYDIGRSTTNGLLYFYGQQTGFAGYVFSSVDGERMRITSSGYVGINNVSPSWLLTVSNTGTSPRIAVEQTGDVACDMITFRRNGSERGKINVTDSATQYQTSSDYRLKENVVPLTNALETVAKLKPSKFNWIQERGGKEDNGFIAHELQEVLPNAVTGEKML